MSTYINKHGRVHSEPGSVDLAAFEAPKAKVNPPITREAIEAVPLAAEEPTRALVLSREQQALLRHVLTCWQRQVEDAGIGRDPAIDAWVFTLDRWSAWSA